MPTLMHCVRLLYIIASLFVQGEFCVQGRAILQNRVHLIATVIMNLHALTMMMCHDRKFINHVAARVTS